MEFLRRVGCAASLLLLFVVLAGAHPAAAQDQRWLIFDASSSALPGQHVSHLLAGPVDTVWAVIDSKTILQFGGGRWRPVDVSDQVDAGPVTGLTLDEQGHLWVATSHYGDTSVGGDVYTGGLLIFDGTAWHSYGPSGSYGVTALASSAGFVWYIVLEQKALGKRYLERTAGIDSQAEIIFGSMSYGPKRHMVAGPDSTFWTILPEVNDEGHRYTEQFELTWYDGARWKGFPKVPVRDVLAVDSLGRVWGQAEEGGLIIFDGTDWIRYTSEGSPLPGDSIRAVAIEDSSTGWIGTDKGLARLEGADWTAYTEANSPLPADDVRTVSVDPYGNKWLGTWGGGVAVFQASGLVHVGLEDSAAPGDRSEDNLRGVGGLFPNPSSGKVWLRYRAARPGPVLVRVVDLLGREVMRWQRYDYRRGTRRAALDVHSLTPGMYLLRIEASGYRKTLRLLKR